MTQQENETEQQRIEALREIAGRLDEGHCQVVLDEAAKANDRNVVKVFQERIDELNAKSPQPTTTHPDVLAAAQEAANAANGDSNDGEIQALRNALEVALSALGLTMPEAEEDEPDGAPCCPDPGCPGWRSGGKGCTFPGYADNH